PVMVSTPKVGATLLTVSANVAIATGPLTPSSPKMVTVPLWFGPSVVANDQLQVPLLVPVLVTVPTDAVIVTFWPLSGSEYVPALAAVWPSLTVTEALFTVPVGRLFTRVSTTSLPVPPV